MYTYRACRPEDLKIIRGFPGDERELYFMYPKAAWPLTEEQLRAAVDARSDSTVVMKGELVIGFANLYEAVRGSHCSIGNAVVHPLWRGRGAGAFLVNTMVRLGLERYSVKTMKVSCFNENIAGILLYTKLGFRPAGIEKRLWKGAPVALIRMEKDVS